MNKQAITPLEKLRLEKQSLKASCKKQEAQLHETMEYVEDNLIQLSLGATARVLTNPRSLMATFKSSTSPKQTSSSENETLDFITKGAFGFAMKAVLGYLIKKKFGKKSISGKVAGMAIPLATPFAASAWNASKPHILKFVKCRVQDFFAWKNKKKAKGN